MRFNRLKLLAFCAVGLTLFAGWALADSDRLGAVSAVSVVDDSNLAFVGEDGQVLWSSGDCQRWIKIRPPVGVIVTGIAGGWGYKLLLLTVATKAPLITNEIPHSLESLTKTGDSEKVAEGIGGTAKFHDQQVGCQIRDRKLLVTTNGAKDWVSVPIPLDPLDSTVHLAWLSSSEFLVTPDARSASLIGLEQGNATLRWTKHFQTSVAGFAKSGESILALTGNDVVAIDIGSGAEIARIKSNMESEGISVGEQRVFLWGYSGIGVLDWDGKTLRPERKLEVGAIAAVVPRMNTIIVISMDGRVSTLDWHSLEEKAAQISIEPVGGPTTAAVFPVVQANFPSPSGVLRDLPTADERQAEMKWGRLVPDDKQNEILSEVERRDDLSPRQRCLLATQKFKEAAGQAGGK